MHQPRVLCWRKDVVKRASQRLVPTHSFTWFFLDIMRGKFAYTHFFKKTIPTKFLNSFALFGILSIAIVSFYRSMTVLICPKMKQHLPLPMGVLLMRRSRNGYYLYISILFFVSCSRMPYEILFSSFICIRFGDFVHWRWVKFEYWKVGADSTTLSFLTIAY